MAPRGNPAKQQTQALRMEQNRNGQNGIRKTATWLHPGYNLEVYTDEQTETSYEVSIFL